MTRAGAQRPEDEPVVEATFEIINERGLHARAATKLVQLAGRFRSEVVIASPEAEGVNAKSVMGVLLLCGAKGTTVTVQARGKDAQECIDAIGALIAGKFGEPE